MLNPLTYIVALSSVPFRDLVRYEQLLEGKSLEGSGLEQRRIPDSDNYHSRCIIPPFNHWRVHLNRTCRPPTRDE